MHTFNITTIVLIGLWSVGAALAEPVRYDNHKVYTLHVTNEDQLQQLRILEETQRYRFWDLPYAVGEATIVVPPHQLADFADLLDSLQLQSELRVDNLQALFDAESPANVTYSTGFNWRQYHTLDEINAWLTSRVQAFPRLLTNFNIGRTTENRQMRVVRLSAKAGNPAIFIEANIHAREWITSATATWLLNELLTSNEPEVRDLATNIDWYFLPVANPDGFAFTRTDRMWRKTRSVSRLCRGADPNRNFNFHWMRGGASSNPCSDTFGGTAAFSEPETRAIRDFYNGIARNTRLYLSLHAFGQYVLLPYGHTTNPSHNHGPLISIGNTGVQAIRRRYGTDYILGSVANVMYVATGSSADWAFGIHSTPLSYTFELRDIRRGPHGFVLPTEQIIPNNLEFFDGLRAMIRHARTLNKI